MLKKLLYGEKRWKEIVNLNENLILKFALQKLQPQSTMGGTAKSGTEYFVLSQ